MDPTHFNSNITYWHNTHYNSTYWYNTHSNSTYWHNYTNIHTMDPTNSNSTYRN